MLQRKRIRDMTPEQVAKIRQKDRERYAARREAKKWQAYEYYHLEKKQVIARRKALKEHDPRKALLWLAKKRAQAKGLEFSITPVDLALPSVCPVLGIPIVYGPLCEGSPSIDRLDNERGYVPGNVLIMSMRANRIKNNGTAAEHRLIAEFMERNEW